jgi:hypothetical protein
MFYRKVYFFCIFHARVKNEEVFICIVHAKVTFCSQTCFCFCFFAMPIIQAETHKMLLSIAVPRHPDYRISLPNSATPPLHPLPHTLLQNPSNGPAKVKILTVFIPTMPLTVSILEIAIF